jgi:hypothetical protein
MRHGWTCLLALSLVFGAPTALARESAAAPAIAEAELETVLALQVSGELDIDAAGAVSAYRIDTKLPEDLRVNLDRSIAAWRFEPIVEGEVLEPTTIRLQVSLAAREGDGAYRVTIENVNLWAKDSDRPGAYVTATADIAPASLRPPTYPQTLVDMGLEGKVLVGLLLKPDGGVAEATVVQSALFDTKGNPATLRRALQMFEKSAVFGARSWRFEVATHGVPTPEDLTVFVPVVYGMDRIRSSGNKWRTLVRTARTPPPWLPAADERARMGVADVGAGGLVPAAANVRLASELAGTTL